MQNFRRRFETHTHVGNEIASSSGYPEGCPLSIVAMLCVNWTYHVYTQVFMPKVSSFSFVDNLTVAGTDPEQIARAYLALQTVCSLFGLLTGSTKIYIWGTTRQTRLLLNRLVFLCLQDANELGGPMTYGAAIRNRSLKQRGAQLLDK